MAPPRKQALARAVLGASGTPLSAAVPIVGDWCNRTPAVSTGCHSASPRQAPGHEAQDLRQPSVQSWFRSWRGTSEIHLGTSTTSTGSATAKSLAHGEARCPGEGSGWRREWQALGPLGGRGLSTVGAGEQQLELEYQKRADECLHHLHEHLDVLVDSAPGNDAFDCDYSDGVLTLRLPPHGTFVLNKQAPNRQIWLSSPVSGPARYEWSVERGAWVNAREPDVELLQLLQGELSSLLGPEAEVSLGQLA